MITKVSTKDTTLEALLTGQVRLASWRNWLHTEVLNLRDPFQNAVPCWQQSCPLPGYDGTTDTAIECPGCGSTNIRGSNQHFDFVCLDCGSKF